MDRGALTSFLKTKACTRHHLRPDSDGDQPRWAPTRDIPNSELGRFFLLHWGIEEVSGAHERYRGPIRTPSWPSFWRVDLMHILRSESQQMKHFK